MNRSRTACPLLLLTAAVLVACADGEPGILGVEATGTVVGLAFIDRDGDEALDAAADGPAAGIRVHLLRGERDTVRQTTTGADGGYLFSDVEVGAYRVVLGEDSLPDLLRLIWIREPTITVSAADTAVAVIALGYRALSVAESRADEMTGRTVVVEAVALNAWQAFGDSTLHLSDGTGSVRALRVSPVDVPEGYRVRVRGTRSVRDGQPVLSDAVATVLGPGSAPEALPLTTGAAADAQHGALDGALVRVEGALIQSAAVAGADFRLTVDDGTGPLDVLLDGDLPFVVDEAYAPGGVLDATGLLTAGPGGRWRLKPRAPSEVSATLTPMSVAAARAMAVGTEVVVEGVALHAWGAFGDSTLHVMDESGALRALAVPPLAAAAGSRVRLHGTVVRQDGQPALREVTARLVGSDTLPVPALLSTHEAATAAGGARDAMPARIAGAAILDGEVSASGNLLLTVSDGSGHLVVALDRDIAFDLSSVSPGAVLEAEGVLVPSGTAGTWRLEPRAPGEVRASYPTLTVAEARAAPMGKRIHLEGVALNGYVTFGDATLHVADETGALRTVGLAPAYVLTGDSVRLLGTVGAVEGQPVLRVERVTVLGSGVPPAPRSLATAAAASAQDGTLDAALVVVAGVVVRDTATTAAGDFLLTVDDGSGELEVLLDRDTGFSFGSWAPDQVLRVTGLLVPAGAGAVGWRLKPRGSADMAREGAP